MKQNPILGDSPGLSQWDGTWGGILGKGIQSGLQGAFFSTLVIKQFPNKMEAKQLGVIFIIHQVIKK